MKDSRLVPRDAISDITDPPCSENSVLSFDWRLWTRIGPMILDFELDFEPQPLYKKQHKIKLRFCFGFASLQSLERQIKNIDCWITYIPPAYIPPAVREICR